MSIADAPEQEILNLLETTTVACVSLRLMSKSFERSVVSFREFVSVYETTIPAVWPCGRYEALNE